MWGAVELTSPSLQVQQYRVAMTAKDCSIMIALSPCLQWMQGEAPSAVSRVLGLVFCGVARELVSLYLERPLADHVYEQRPISEAS